MAIEDAERFFSDYQLSQKMQKEFGELEASWPGSLENREYLVEDVLIPYAVQQGYDFSLSELRRVERRVKMEKYRDVEQDPDEPDDETCFFLMDRGWFNDESIFKKTD